MMYLYMNIVKNVILIHMYRTSVYKFTGGETGHVHIYKYVYVKNIYIYTYTYLYLMNV